jgi:hypothetical protein
MRLALALGSLLVIGFCTPVYPPTTSDTAVLAPDTPEGSYSYASEFPLLEVVEKTKPNVKGKPRPPKPDALPTYELVAAVQGLAGAVQADLLR